MDEALGIILQGSNMDEETKRLIVGHESDEDIAKKARELIDEGLDENEAIEIAEDV